MKNSFFHLHIPRTGGTHFQNNMFPAIENILIQNNISYQKIDEDQTAHWCWFEPLITDSTLIYACFRDPAERLVSQFANQARQAVISKNTNYSLADINKNSFFKWLEDNYETYKNVQAKCLVYYNKDHSIYKPASDTIWLDGKSPQKQHYMFDSDFIKYTIDKNLIKQRLNRVDIKIRISDIQSASGQAVVLKNILQHYGLSSNMSFDKISNQDYSTGLTSLILSDLSKQEINFIYEYQNIDSEIYFSKYF